MGKVKKQTGNLKGNQEENSNNKNTVLIIILFAIVGMFLYYKGNNKDNDNDDGAEDDVIDDKGDGGYDFSGLRAAVDATEINGMGWKDFADSHLVTRNNGGSASEVVDVTIDTIVRNEGWVDNLREPAEWAAMTLHKYVILHAIGFAMEGCKLKAKNEELGEFELNHTRTMNGYFELGNCKASDF